jgi:hypothetical protein
MDKLNVIRLKALARKRRAEAEAAQQPPQQDMAWSDVPMEALRNTPSSAGQFVSDMVQPILHPIQTADNLLNLAAGGISRGVEAVAGDQSWLPENKATATADAVGQFYKDRYGSAEGLKRSLAQDPIGVLGDASTVLTGGAGATMRVPGAVGRVGRVLDTAARATNPLTVPTKAAQATGKAVGGTAKHVLGLTTGTSPETIAEAYRAGRSGGTRNRAFKDNMRGKEAQASVIEDAKGAIENIADARRTQYQRDMQQIGASAAPVDLGPVRQRVADLIDEAFIGGHQKASNETVKKLIDIADIVDEWSADPAMHNAIGVDALKQRIDDLMPSFAEAGNAERVVTAVRNEVKNAIVQQVPEYADAMKSYESSKSVQRELEQSLKLGKKNSADSALRALQSVTRNNANTNYGSRVNSAKMLEDAGATELMPKLAGQALNTFTPRGLMKAVAGGIGFGGLLNPALWAALPATSPRLVGEATNIAGALARGASRLPKPTREQLLILRALGVVGQPEQLSQR